MTYIANKLIREIGLIPRDEEGFYDCQLANGWIARVRYQSLRVSFPKGTDSYDATERHEFLDGSAIVVGNPDQIAFSLSVYEEA